MFKAEKITEAQVQEAGKAYESGISSKELGLKYGVTPTTIVIRLKRAGFDTRTRKPVNEVEFIKSYQNINSPLKQVCLKFGINERHGKDILIKNNIRIKTHSEATIKLLSEKEKKDVLSIYTPELGVSETSKILGLSRRVVDRFLKENGLRVISNTECRKLTQTQELEAIKMLENNTVPQIAQHFGCCRSVIQKIIKRNKLKTKHGRDILRSKFWQKIEPLKQEIVIHYKTHKSIEKIIRDYNISYKVVVKILDGSSAHRYKKRISFSDSEIQDIIKYYTQDKMGVWDIVFKIHSSHVKVMQILKQHNIKITNHRHKKNSNKYISGHYKGHLFRSLNELSFMVNYLNKKGIPINSGEHHDGIPYFYNGKDRLYFPDFITDKYIFELKPKVFQKKESVMLKKEAGTKYAEQIGLTYRLVDFPVILKPIYLALLNGDIVFYPLAAEKFIKRFGRKLAKIDTSTN